MRNLVIFTALCAALAWGGTRATQTTGQLPAAATDGVSLVDVSACRASIRYTDGGTATAGALVPYYYDAVLGWREGPKLSQCTLDSDTQVDGGARFGQLCEWRVINPFGRAAVVPKGLSPQPVGIIRLECYGERLP